MSSETNSDTQAYFLQRYSKVLESFSGEAVDIIISHNGELSLEMVNSLAYGMEKQLVANGEKKGIIKRLFSIIIEVLQNIRLHGCRDENNYQDSFIVLAKDDKKYTLITANLAQDEAKVKISKHIEKINSFDRAELKEMYMNTLTDGEISSKGGAGLGFITIAMKSKNKVGYKFDIVKEGLNYFEMESVIQLN